MTKSQNRQRVLITGGSGMIGQRLTQMLLEKGYEVAWLSRRAESVDGVTTYQWDVNRGTIDEESMEGLFAVVHLAGAGVADKRWNETRKQVILESRTLSTKLLVEKLKQVNKKPEVFVGASGIGYYGLDTGDTWVDETASAGQDFLADVVKQWEAASEPVEQLGIRRVMIRTGVVLSDKGGALPRLAAPVKWGVGATLGSGGQWMSWVHIDDLCRLFLEAIENRAYNGALNGVGPDPATNRAFTRQVAKVLRRPLWLPPVPGFVMRLLVGEMAGVVLGGNRVSCRKTESLGFSFSYPELGSALEELLG